MKRALSHEPPNIEDESAPFVVRPQPWRVLRFYFWTAFALTAGPLLVGLWAGLVGYLMTRCTVGEVFEQCVKLVGYAPILGLVVVILALPAGWVILREFRTQSWSVDAEGITVSSNGVASRRIPWSEVATVRVGVNGPLLIMKDRTQEGEQLVFVPREISVRLHKEWSKRQS